MGRFDPMLPLAGLKPASYNPRRITEADRAVLRESLRTLGPVRPIISTEEGTLVAGHQRTNAMRAEGWTHAPGFVLPPITAADEVRFNQLHNASDVELADFKVRVSEGPQGGWYFETPGGLKIEGTPRHAYKRDEILRLLTKYGEWSSVVASETGEVLVGQLYASACKVLGRGVRVRYVPESSRADVLRYFSREYGVFSYAHLDKTPWVQSLAQMFRLRGQETGGKSRTYERCVLPQLKPGMRVLDFGAGQLDYVKALQKRGVDIRGVEFFLRTRDKLAVDKAGVHRLVDALCRDLAARGRYDLVVCDSVLNSVDSVQAEKDVMACVNALCRPGGKVVVSGRGRERIEALENNTTRKADSQRMGLLFLDEDGLSAMYREGGWLYQKFHWRAQVEQLGREYVGPDAKVSKLDDSWFLTGTKAVEADPVAVDAALRREFDLPWPDGTRVGRAEEVRAAYLAGVAREG